MAITNKQIKSILNENYNRLLSKKGSDRYADQDSLNELACTLWEREDRLLESQMDNRDKDIAQELERFKTEFDCLKAWLFTFGDSQYLRNQMTQCINEYSQFSEGI